MKHLLYILAVLVCTAVAVPAVHAKKDTGTPAVTLREKDHNFGSIAEDGGPVSHEFEFKNTGDSPLVIVSATASCGCTRPTYPLEPVKPGKTGKIKVTYLPQGRPGEFNKTVKVRTNAPGTKKFTLRISGSVVPQNPAR